MSELTPEYEQEIRDREAAATAGPWGTYYENPMSDFNRLIDIAADLEDTGHGYRCRRCIGQLESGQIDNDPTHKDWDADEDNDQSAADAEFIAHARQDVPALLAEVERLRGELAASASLARERFEVIDRLRAELAGRPTRAEVLRKVASDLRDAGFADSATTVEEAADRDAWLVANMVRPSRTQRLAGIADELRTAGHHTAAADIDKLAAAERGEDR